MTLSHSFSTARRLVALVASSPRSSAVFMTIAILLVIALVNTLPTSLVEASALSSQDERILLKPAPPRPISSELLTETEKQQQELLKQQNSNNNNNNNNHDSSNSLLQHRCIHDEEIVPLLKKHPQITLPQQYHEGALEFGTHGSPRRRDALPAAAAPKPIRFNVSAVDFFNTSRSCQKVGEFVMDFKGNMRNCSDEEDILTPEKRDVFLNRLLPKALEKLSRSLHITPINGPIFGLYQNICPDFTVPQNILDDGVNHSDYIMFIAGGPTPSGNIAWAGGCVNGQDGRPIIGRLNIGPRYIKYGSIFEEERVIGTLIHEAIHALGFSADAFTNNFHVTGLPTVVEQGKRTTRGGLPVTELITPLASAASREFFGCNDSTHGVELENQGGTGTAFSHIERRNYYEEVMTGVQGDINRLSRITLSVFEDMTYYFPNYSEAEIMYYGNGTGCLFLDQKCNSTQMPFKAQELFCANSTTTEQLCTYNGYSGGKCNLAMFTTVPSYFQYYPNPQIGGNTALMDVCPVVDNYVNYKCREGNLSYGTANEKILGHTHGLGGRCLSAPFIIESGFVSPTAGDAPFRCVILKCVTQKTPAGQWWKVKLQIRDSPFVECPENGGEVTAPAGYTGTLNCPAPKDLCFRESRMWGEDLIIEELPEITQSTLTTYYFGANGSTYTLASTSTTTAETTTTTTASETAGTTSSTINSNPITTQQPVSAPTTTVDPNLPVVRSFFIGTKNASLCLAVFNAAMSSEAAFKTAAAQDLGTLLGFSATATNNIQSIQLRADGCVTVNVIVPAGKAAQFDSTIASGNPSFLSQTSNFLSTQSSEAISPGVLNLGQGSAPNSPGGTTTADPNGNNGNGGNGTSPQEEDRNAACFLADQPCYISYIVIVVAIVLTISLVGWFCKKMGGEEKRQEEEQRQRQQQRQPQRRGSYCDEPVLGNQYSQMQQEMQTRGGGAGGGEGGGRAVRYDDL